MDFRLTFAFLFLLVFSACNQTVEVEGSCAVDGKRFTSLQPSHTKILFNNTLQYTEEFNTYTYRNFYNGAGVGIGDVNNDGLPDIFFCGNMVSNKLYLNKGNFQFEDVTTAAGLLSEGVWSTGVSLVDINGDGLLDIYVCKSGKPEGPKRHNELFINVGANENGIPTFVEKSKEYGIGDYGLSTHAAFFDYDKDGDLDMYLLNNSIRSIGGFDLQKNQRLIRDPQGGNKLYRNDGSTFTDVSEQAGIYGSMIGYGLGVTIGDINRDGWQDIFVSNDFFEKDYLYINNRNGTFAESLEKSIGEISLGSMGADMADINNDGFPEIFVTEMLPEQEARLKTKTIFEDWDKYQANYTTGYHRQFPRNVLQLNRGYVPSDTNRNVMFSEISRYAGVNATDWSWGALIADLDNDGLKDIFVANGIYKDLTDLDYINFYADPATTKKLYKEKGKFLKELIDKIPSNAIPNYAFRNKGDLTFENVAAEWGLNCPSFSNGSAYGDLDNDGDLDLVINNVNMAPFVLRNNTETLSPDNHFISLKLLSLKDKNRNGLGAQVTIKAGGQKFYQELAPMRGYQSTVDQRLHFGLGKHVQADSIIIQWPDTSIKILTDIKTNQLLVIQQDTVKLHAPSQTSPLGKQPLFSDASKDYALNDKHVKTDFIDFNRDPLLFNMLSAEGPKLAVGDVNGDGRLDVFIGSGKNQVSSLYVQTSTGGFRHSNQPSFLKDLPSEDACADFFDADQDGDLDLYVGSGGNEFLGNSIELCDNLFTNDGKGNFIKSVNSLPANLCENTSCVKAADFDGDGDQDLFVGVRAKPFQYGIPVNGYLLENNGKGKFKNVTQTIAPALMQVGMITDARWFDYDRDDDLDLIIVGDWMPITLFKNENGIFSSATGQTGLDKTNGFWNCIEVADLDLDGDLDLVAGNQGMNTRFNASYKKPVTMYVSDYDGNGKIEQIITTYKGDKAYPMHMRADLIEQIPSLKKKYLKHSSYKEQTVHDIFGEELISKSLQLKVYTTKSICLMNSGKGFLEAPLPIEAQFAPVYSISIDDYNNDKTPDILIGGNFYWSKPEVGIYDGSAGLLLRGEGKGVFSTTTMDVSGICVRGEIRDIKNISVGKERLVIIARTNDKPVILKRKK
jgi:hypothetical protein